jgi:hypothetical protein
MTPTLTHPTQRLNFTIVSTEAIDYAFSYETCIGFNVGTGWHVIENQWGTTTGGHLKFLESAGTRQVMTPDEFAAALAAVEEG